MLNNPTVEKLKSMKLKVMAQMLAEPDNSLRELSFEERLGIMVEKEWLQKKNALIQRLLRKASFGLDACTEDIDYTVERTIDKKVIKTLSTCSFIEQKLNIILSGKTGTGKTYIACAIGNAACLNGYSVKYLRVPELLLEIQQAKNENRYLKFITGLGRIKLLVLDDLGHKSYTLEESRDILEIAENRYNRASTILAGQIAHTKWYDLFPDPTIAEAIMDRIIHNSYILALDSKLSMREVMAKKAIKNVEKNDKLD